jgi:DNA polymerase-4
MAQNPDGKSAGARTSDDRGTADRASGTRAAGPVWPRTILHADMDAFYASVEQLDNPQLRGKPLLIGVDHPRSVVSTASYEARPFGVGSAMPMVEAKRRCPQAIIVPPRMQRYAEVSEQIMTVFHDFSPHIEPLSLDEAFVDLTGSERLLGPPDVVAHNLKAAVKRATGGLNVSVGVSGCKYVAKVASDVNKPNGLLVVPPDEMVAFLAPLPVSRLWGVGKRGEEQLKNLDLRTIGDVANADPLWLKQRLGSMGVHVYALAHADDPRGVVSDREAVSISSEETLDVDGTGRDRALPAARG